MSPPKNGVALYTIMSMYSKCATLPNNTPRQYVTQEYFEEGRSEQTWVVSYDAETGIATIKNAVADGHYATVNDLLSFVVGDTYAQEFKLILKPNTSDYFAIQMKDTDKVWYPDYIDGVNVIRAASIPDPTTDDASWWVFKLVPGVESEA